METRHWSDKLIPQTACREALIWVRTQPDPKTAWLICERGDWMLWLLSKQTDSPESASLKKLVLIACSCARLALPYVKMGECRPLIAIEIAERWAHTKNRITSKEIKSASTASASAAASAPAYASAAASAADDANSKILKQCAEIVRQHYSKPPIPAKTR